MRLDPADAATIVDALVQNAQRLGLKWSLRPGTITDGLDPGKVRVKIDGDDAATIVTSLVGKLVRGTRVYLTIIPDVGTYVTGFLGMPRYVHTGETGTVSAGPAAAASFTAAVLFEHPFDEVPNVHINLNSGAGSTSGWAARAINVSTTGFTLFGFGTSSTFTATWQWSALRLTNS